MSRTDIVLGRTAKESVPLIDSPAPSWIKECVEKPWNGRKPIGTGAYVAKVDDTEFYFAFRESDSGSRRVLVSLTGGAYGNTRKDGSRFSRWKYSDETDANVLCVDDPMVFMHGIKYGWFAGGTEECPMWASLGRLVTKVCAAAGLKNPDIVFFSSSSGGTASLLASSTLGVPCTVVAMNPQLVPANAARYPAYMKRGHLCPLLSDPDYVFGIIKEHKENRYVIMENLASSRDYNRYFSPLCSYLSIEPVYGISHRSNLVTWVYNAPSGTPHQSMDWKTFFPAIEFVVDNFDKMDSVSKHLLGMFTGILEEHHAAAERIAELEGGMKKQGGPDEKPKTLKAGKKAVSRKPRSRRSMQSCFDGACGRPVDSERAPHPVPQSRIRTTLLLPSTHRADDDGHRD